MVENPYYKMGEILMELIKHIGIYVDDEIVEKNFYMNVFSMRIICENFEDEGEVYNQLLGEQNVKVSITKLITERGIDTGLGDMIELIKLKSSVSKQNKIDRAICDVGLSHFSIGVDGIEDTVNRILKNGGGKITDIIKIGERKCCFCYDPEGNGIELIE